MQRKRFMITTVQRVSLPENRRILMTSDIHGHADGLARLLRKAGFGREDILVLVGDYVEKGPQSLKTVRFIMDLCQTHTVYPLMGNVDLWRLEFLQSGDPAAWREMADYSFRAKGWWGSSLLHEMCEEIGSPLTGETDIAALFPEIQRHFSPEIDFIASLPTILETQRMIFVHGGVPHERLEELEGTDAFPLLKFDDFYNAGLFFQKYVAVGHWPAVLYSKTYPVYDPLIDRERRIISLDGACGVKYEGQLNMLALPHVGSEEFSLYTWDHLPTVTALDGQAPSPAKDARYIRWNDHAIQMVRRGEEMSRILYHGQPMDVPTQYVFYHDGVLSCSDTTDYTLPVSPGDHLRLILQLSHGCYVKKDGISGWYYGRYEKNEVNEP